MTILSTVVAVSLESFSFSSFAAFSSFVGLQRHQLPFNLVQSIRRMICPSFLFLSMRSSFTRIMTSWLCSTSFVSNVSSILQSADLGKQCVDFHRDRFVMFPLSIKVSIPLDPRHIPWSLGSSRWREPSISPSPSLWVPSCGR